MALHLLLVEDDRLLSEVVSDYFVSKGWKVTQAFDGEMALDCFYKDTYALMLLDVMLPKENGFQVCKKVREVSDIPIFFITARVMEEDELNGYATGADDYITKPFSLPVLYAKAMAMMNRVRGEDSGNVLKKGDVEIYVKNREIVIRGQKKTIPPMEYDMLKFFLENTERIFSREQLLIRFWGYDFDGNERVVDNHIKKLRRVLTDSECVIETIRKSGYRMHIPKGEM